MPKKLIQQVDLNTQKVKLRKFGMLLKRKMEKFMILIQEKSLFGMEVKKENGIWVINQEENIKKIHKDYMDGKISKGKFLKEVRNPDNYRPEAPSSNRSHKYEQK